MVYKCSVPVCKGNYPKGPKVRLFSFPTQEEMRRKWIAAIHANFTLTEYSKVCELHFTESDIQIYSEYYDERTDRTLRVPLKRHRLKPFAVPSLFPDYSQYVSTVKRSREDCDEKRISPEGLANTTAQENTSKRDVNSKTLELSSQNIKGNRKRARGSERNHTPPSKNERRKSAIFKLFGNAGELKDAEENCDSNHNSSVNFSKTEMVTNKTHPLIKLNLEDIEDVSEKFDPQEQRRKLRLMFLEEFIANNPIKMKPSVKNSQRLGEVSIPTNPKSENSAVSGEYLTDLEYCHLCDKIFENESIYTSHMDFYHPKNAVKKSRTSDPSHACSTEGRTPYFQEEQQSIIPVPDITREGHNIRQLFRCSKCHKTFKTAQALRGHKLDYHSGSWQSE